VTSNGCRAKEEDVEDKQHQGQQQRCNQEEFAPRVAEIHGPPEAVALRDKHSRIVGIVVKEACRPVPIIIAENGAGELTISGCARFCPGTLRMPEQDEDDGKQQSTHQQEKEPNVHGCSSFKARRDGESKTFHYGKRIPPAIPKLLRSSACVNRHPGLLSDNGSIFKAKQAKHIYEAPGTQAPRRSVEFSSS